MTILMRVPAGAIIDRLEAALPNGISVARAVNTPPNRAGNHPQASSLARILASRTRSSSSSMTPRSISECASDTNWFSG